MWNNNIAKGIKSIHELGYCHRDIKPNNILIVGNQIKLADFGLVWHPNFVSRTYNDERVGPVETIAPEMRENNSELKHSSKADIYSFVKTMWMLILSRKRAFVGEYCYATTDYLSCNMEIFKRDGIRTVSGLNELIMRGTKVSPINRPSIDEVIKSLESFVIDIKLPDKDINLINHREVIKQSLCIIESDTEGITKLSKMKDFFNRIFTLNLYILESEKLDGSRDTKFEVQKIQVTEIDSGIIFVSTNNKRYLLVVNKLEIDKQKNKITLETKDIIIENLPTSRIYEFVDYYSVDIMDSLIGNFEEQNDKSVIEVMSKAETLILSVTAQNI